MLRTAGCAYLEDEMSAEIIQLRDYQNPKDIERMQRELEKEAKDALEICGIQTDGISLSAPMGWTQNPEQIPYGGKGIDGMDLGKEPA